MPKIVPIPEFIAGSIGDYAVEVYGTAYSSYKQISFATASDVVYINIWYRGSRYGITMSMDDYVQSIYGVLGLELPSAAAE